MINPGKNIIQHPVKQTKVNALHHAHVVQVDMQTALLHLLQLAAVVTGEAKSRQTVSIGPIDGS